MSQDNLVKLVNKDTGTVLYSKKNKKKLRERLTLRKFDPAIRVHAEFKETK